MGDFSNELLWQEMHEIWRCPNELLYAISIRETV